ncbi:hypothetical protein P2318_21760 [Myxococcaceae bacterium GXIMD 01537]
MRVQGVVKALATLGLVLSWGCGGLPEEATPTEELSQETIEAAHRSDVRPGETLWVRHSKGSGFEAGTKVVVDRDGNNVVLFFYRGKAKVGSITLPESTGGGAYGLAKYDAEGHLKWARGFVAVDPPPVNFATIDLTALAVDDRGNIYFGGNSEAPVDFGGGPVDERFLVTLSPNGHFRWQLEVEGDDRFFPTGFGFTRSGDIILGGYFFGTIDLGGGPLGGSFLPSAFLAKFTSEGDPLWSFSETGPNGTVISGVALDRDDNIYAALGIDWNNDNEFRGGAVARYSPRGHREWFRRLSNDSEITGLAVRDNRVVAVGSFVGEFVFKGHTFHASNFSDVFVIAYNRSGAERWIQTLGQFDAAVAMDDRGGVGVTGRFEPGDVIGGKPQGAIGNFVAKFESADGDFQWARTFPSFASPPPFDIARANQYLASTRKGELVLTGGFSTRTDFGPVAFTPNGTDMFLLKMAR